MSGQALEPVLAVEAGRSSGRPHRGVFATGLAVALAGLVTLGVLAHRVPWFPIDLAITRHVQDMRAVWICDLLRPFNQLGFPPLVAIFDGAIILLALAARARWEAVTLGFAAVGSSGLNHLAKALVDRPRPPELLVHVEHVLPVGSSFPAGHVLNFTAFAGFLCYLAWVRVAPSALRTALVALLVVMIALMGVARIHAGEHWPSDVLGGYLIGILRLAATIPPVPAVRLIVPPLLLSAPPVALADVPPTAAAPPVDTTTPAPPVDTVAPAPPLAGLPPALSPGYSNAPRSKEAPTGRARSKKSEVTSVVMSELLTPLSMTLVALLSRS